MRIALIVPGGVDRSGEVRVIPTVLALIERLAREHDVQVIALNQEDLPAQWTLLGATVHNIGRSRTRIRAWRLIVRLHRVAPFDVLHAIWSGPCGLVAVAASKFLHVPSVVHVAGGEIAALPEIAYGGALHWRGRIREHFVLRAATIVTSASDPIIRALERLGIPAHRLPFGVDLNRWPPLAPRERNTRNSAHLIHVASLNPVKDQTTLLHALAQLSVRGVMFDTTIVGEDTLHGAIQSLARTLGLANRVSFAGFRTQHELYPRVCRADLLVMASRHETGPLAVLEAAVVGVPTVGTAVGHMSEWSPDAALAVPVGDAAALADAVQALLADEPQRLAMAREAQRRAIAQDADFTASETLNLYAAAIALHAGDASKRSTDRR